MSFNHNLLRMFRARKNISQTKLSEIAKVSNNIYWAMEKGQRNSQINNLIKVIKALELSDSEILLLMKGE